MYQDSSTYSTASGADNYADFFMVGDQYARTYKSN